MAKLEDMSEGELVGSEYSASLMMRYTFIAALLWIGLFTAWYLDNASVAAQAQSTFIYKLINIGGKFGGIFLLYMAGYFCFQSFKMRKLLKGFE